MTTQPPEDPAGAGTLGRDPLEVVADVIDDVARELDPEELASMERLDQPRRVLFVHAHPDDESLCAAGTMARYADAGAHVALLTATRGELGDIVPAEHAHLDPDGLGALRTHELATAMEALGVTDHRFLARPDGTGYRDPGMVWAEPGRAAAGADIDPRAFVAADPEEAALAVAEVIRELRPQVVVTYEPGGGYGHPDHVRVHEATMRGLVLAAGGGPDGSAVPWTVAKVYWHVLPESVARAGVRRLHETGAPGAADPGENLPSMVTPDADVTTAIDVTEQLAAKVAALRAHATQLTLDLEAEVPALRLSNDAPQPVLPREFFRLVHGVAAGPFDSDGRETDLFSGVAPNG